MSWAVLAVLMVAALIALTRIGAAVRSARSRSDEDWDAQQVKHLRAAGGNAFTPYEVDFFFSVPTEAACGALRGVLEPEGFTVDTRAMSGEAASGFSLHARKRLRVSVDEMQGFTRRFRELAQQHGGQYDGWATDPSRK